MHIRRSAGTLLVLQCFGITHAAAQIVTDGSMGPGVTLTGPDFQIGEALGTRLGTNLFHSFTEFNVQLNESATFTSNFAGVTDNVISRVTGGNPSMINGLLSSEIAGADFWFINPNGLVFGENAVIDVPAGFHASTADVLELADGGTFRATNPGASSLTIANPSAFGFLDATIGSISVDGATLAVADGQNLSFVGGAVSFSDATLTANGGRIDVFGAGSAGQVSAIGTQGSVLGVTGMTAFADVDIAGSTFQAGTSSAQNGGTIGIVGGEVTLSQASLLEAETTGAGAGGAVSIGANELTLTNASVIDVSASAEGDAGQVVIAGAGTAAAADVNIVQSSDILANSTATGVDAGSAGSIEVTSESILIGLASTLSASTVDGSNLGTGGEPVGSRIEVVTNDLVVDVSSQIVAWTTGAGQGGSISVDILDPAEEFNIEILEESSIETVATGTGNAGSIRLGSADAPADLLRLAPSMFVASSGKGLFSDTRGAGPDAGDAGSIQIFARTLNINAADISVASGTFGQDDAGGDAGSIDIHVGTLIFVGTGASISSAANGTGDSGSITVTAAYSDTPTITMVDGVMTTRSRGSGDAGRIVIGTEANPFDLIFVRDPVQQSLPNDFPQGFESTSLGTGDAGDIEINALHLVLRDGAQISTSTDAGDGGDILLRVDELEVARFSQITASSSGAGDAGDITITGIGGVPPSLVTLAGTGDLPGPDTGIFSNGGGTGDAGDITITASSVLVQDEASISADTLNGAGGTTSLQVDSLTLLRDGTISGSTSGIGNAGDIVISGVDGVGPASGVTLALGGSILSRSTATGANAGAAGNVEIHATNLTLAVDSRILGNNVDGDGGTVTIRANNVDLFDSQISVIGIGQGDAGDISVSGAGSAAAATSLNIRGSNTSGLFSSSNGTGVNAGAAGSIFINALDVELSDRGVINASTVDGAGGQIELRVDELHMTDQGRISAGTFGEGDAGQILIHGSSAAATQSVVLSGSIEGEPSISTGAFQAQAAIMPAGDGGDIQIVANSLELSDGASINSSTLTLGSGGTINLQVDELTITGAAAVTAATHRSGNAGSIVVTGSDGGAATLVSISGAGSGFATDSLSREADGGQGGSISIHSDAIVMEDQSTISSSTAGGGAGGSIDLEVDDLQVLSGSVITASTLVLGLPSASATGTGDAGSILIHGTSGNSSVLVDGDGSAILSTSSLDANNAGSSGDITIQSGLVEITNQGAISVGTVGGEGGNISIEADELGLHDGATLSVRSTGTGRAGSVFTDIGRLFMTGNSQIDATATSSLAGNVELNVSEIAFLQDSLISGLSADPENDGGNFIIQQPLALVMQRSSILANSASGAGGNISITADAIVIDVDSTVEATGEVLAVGEVLGSVLQLEPPVVVDAAAALDTSCRSQQAEDRSSMVVRSTPPGAVREPYLPADAVAVSPSCKP